MIMVISMSNVYVLNENGVFFTVANNVHVVKDVLIEGGCTLHNSINELYDAVIEKNGIDRDEIDGAELQIILKDGNEICYDPTVDLNISIDRAVEYFITEYEV